MRDTGLRTCEDVARLGLFAVYRCPSCGNAFTAPDPEPDAYELALDAPQTSLSPIEEKLLHWFIGRRFKKLHTPSAERARMLLDIGGGACAFANAAAKQGYDVTVVEPNERNRTFIAGQNRVRFLADRFSDDLIGSGVLAESSFDIVTMWHSLEHMPRPVETLVAIRRVLKSGGVLVVSVPNMNSLQAKFGGNLWTYLDVPHHLCHFTPAGLRMAIRASGLVPVRSFRFSAEYDPFGWYQTILNVVSRSHNYYYNRRKKRRMDDSYLRYPRWTKCVTASGPMFLPFAALATTVSWIVRSASCVEILAVKEPA